MVLEGGSGKEIGEGRAGRGYIGVEKRKRKRVRRMRKREGQIERWGEGK